MRGSDERLVGLDQMGDKILGRGRSRSHFRDRRHSGQRLESAGGEDIQRTEALGDVIEMPGLDGADSGTILGGMVAFIGAIILVYSLVYVAAGIGVLRNRGWGRVTGLIVGILSGLVWLGTVVTPDQPGVRESIVGSLLAFGVHAYIVVALLFFWRSRPSSA